MSRLADVARRVRARFGAVLRFSAAFGVVEAALLQPLVALFLHFFLRRYGRASVGNFEIAQFLLSPLGVVALLTLGSVLLAGSWIHFVGLLHVLGDPPSTPLDAFRAMLRDARRLLRLASWQVGTTLLVALPLVLATQAIVLTIWRGWDLNALLVLRPPVLWRGLAAAAAPALLLVGSLLWLLLRWLFAPSILLEDPAVPPRTALRTSVERTRGRHGRHMRALAMLALSLGIATALIELVLVGLAKQLLDSVGTSRAAALSAAAIVVVVWSVASILVAWSAHALGAGLVDRLHREATGRPPAAGFPLREPGPRKALAKAALALCALAAGTAFAGYRLLATQRLEDDIEITAHRMGATAAPENTLAALRHAITEGADWAELDVQLTSDGELVVLHDFDLLRIGGPAKPVADATAAEVRAIDVGSGLGQPAFAGERVPTLDEVIAVAGDRIRLNIELKPPTPQSAPALTDAVLVAVRGADLIGRCRVCSQSYQALQRAKEAEPALEVGFIAGAALGDLTDLRVDFLMVNAQLATSRLVRQAHARGMQVHPWTVNDVALLQPLLDRGVDNVITDSPAAMRQRLVEIRALELPERLLLRVRNWLGE